MSFSTNIKNELCNIETNSLEAIAELSAIIKINNHYTTDIKIITENKEVGIRIYKLIKDLYNISCKITLRKRYNFDKGVSYILQVSKNTPTIKNNLYLDDSIILSEDEEIKRAYLRGLFISSGSINNPLNSNYHLEFFIKDYQHSNFINELLNQYFLNSKIIKRQTGYMIYIKEAEKIADFLRLIKAFNSLMEYENIRIVRDNSNRINRLNNCEQANLEKSFNTSYKQINDINLIIQTLGIDALDDKSKLIATYRLKHKEASLIELSEIISLETNTKISKSGLNHRFKKITDLANTLK